MGLFDFLFKRTGRESATTNEGAVKLLKTLLEYAPEELAAAKQAASRRQEQEREQKHSRVNSSNKFTTFYPNFTTFAVIIKTGHNFRVFQWYDFI